jgi:hypothetical protein
MVALRYSAVLYSTSKYDAPSIVSRLTHHDSTQKILQNARLVERGVIPRDPVKESISLELDMINIL